MGKHQNLKPSQSTICRESHLPPEPLVPGRSPTSAMAHSHSLFIGFSWFLLETKQSSLKTKECANRPANVLSDNHLGVRPLEFRLFGILPVFWCSTCVCLTPKLSFVVRFSRCFQPGSHHLHAASSSTALLLPVHNARRGWNTERRRSHRGFGIRRMSRCFGQQCWDRAWMVSWMGVPDQTCLPIDSIGGQCIYV